MIDALTREGHFLDHIAPTWLALPDELRGSFYTSPDLVERASRAGIEAETAMEVGPGPLTLVASYLDLKFARRRGRLCVLSEHGAGQSYVGTKSGSYIGAPDRAGVVAVLVPGHEQAARHAASHPTIPAYPVGVPKLDPLHRSAAEKAHTGRTDPVVAISFHWSCTVAPEARGALAHYRRALPELARRFKLIGHSHPRGMDRAARSYRRHGIEVVHEFAEVIERADVFACDNSSAMYEWASLDRPVVVLNAPWFRRGVEHGLRFWRHADLGPQVDEPAELPDAVALAASDPPEMAEPRRQIVRAVYVACDGRAVERAVDALTEIHDRWGAHEPAEPPLHADLPLGVG